MAPDDAVRVGTYAASGAAGFVEGFRSGPGKVVGQVVAVPIAVAEVGELPALPWDQYFATAGASAMAAGWFSRRLVSHWSQGSGLSR